MDRLNGPMLSILLCVAMVLAAGCVQAAPQAPDHPQGKAITFIDSKGSEITLQGTAQRIIATNADCAEMLIAIGAGDKVVGVTDTVWNSPLLMARLPGDVRNVGSWQSPNVEIMLALEPDVVICYGYASRPKNIDHLELADLTLVFLDCYKTNALASDARVLGQVTGNMEQAEDYADFLEGCIRMVASNTSQLPDDRKPWVYWESYADYSTVGKGSAGDLMINLSGGLNVAGTNATAYPKVNPEWVLESNPAFVYKMIAANNATSEGVLRDLQADILARPGMDQTDAVKDGHVYVMSGSIAFGARSVIGLVYMARAMHPDIYADVNPGEVLKEYARRYLPGSDQGVFICPQPS